MLVLIKDVMKRVWTCLHFVNDMLGRKVPIKCTSYGNYHILLTRPLPNRGKFNQIFFIENIITKNRSEKVTLQPNYLENSVILDVKSYVI